MVGLQDAQWGQTRSTTGSSSQGKEQRTRFRGEAEYLAAPTPIYCRARLYITSAQAKVRTPPRHSTSRTLHIHTLYILTAAERQYSIRQISRQQRQPLHCAFVRRYRERLRPVPPLQACKAHVRLTQAQHPHQGCTPPSARRLRHMSFSYASTPPTVSRKNRISSPAISVDIEWHR